MNKITRHRLQKLTKIGPISNWTPSKLQIQYRNLSNGNISPCRLNQILRILNNETMNPIFSLYRLFFSEFSFVPLLSLSLSNILGFLTLPGKPFRVVSRGKNNNMSWYHAWHTYIHVQPIRERHVEYVRFFYRQNFSPLRDSLGYEEPGKRRHGNVTEFTSFPFFLLHGLNYQFYML